MFGDIHRFHFIDLGTKTELEGFGSWFIALPCPLYNINFLASLAKKNGQQVFAIYCSYRLGILKPTDPLCELAQHPYHSPFPIWEISTFRFLPSQFGKDQKKKRRERKGKENNRNEYDLPISNLPPPPNPLQISTEKALNQHAPEYQISNIKQQPTI